MAVKNIDYLSEDYLAKINEEKTTYLSTVERANGKVGKEISIENLKYLDKQKQDKRDVQGDQIKSSNEEKIVISETNIKKEQIPVTITETQQKKNMISIMNAISSDINKEGKEIHIKASSKTKEGAEILFNHDNIVKEGTDVFIQSKNTGKDGKDISVPVVDTNIKDNIEVKTISPNKNIKNSLTIKIVSKDDVKKGTAISNKKIVLNYNLDKKSTAGPNEFKTTNEVKIIYTDLDKHKNGKVIDTSGNVPSKKNVIIGFTQEVDDGKGKNFTKVPIDTIGELSKKEIPAIFPYTADAMFDAKNLSQVSQGDEEGKHPFQSVSIPKDKASKEVVISYKQSEKDLNEFEIEISKEVNNKEELDVSKNIEDTPKILKFQSMYDNKITFIAYYDNLRDKYIDKIPQAYTSGVYQKVEEDYIDNSKEKLNITEAIPFKDKIDMLKKIEDRKGAQLYKETGDVDSDVIGQADINNLVNKNVPIKDLQTSVFLYNIIPYSLSSTGEKVIEASAEFLKEKDQSFTIGSGIIKGGNNIYSLMNKDDITYSFTDFLTTFGSGILGLLIKTRNMGTMKDLVLEDPTFVSNELLLNNTLRYAGTYYSIVANPYEVSEEYGGTAIKGKSNIKSVYHFLKEDTREDGSYMPTLKKYIDAQKELMPASKDQFFDTKYLDININKAFERGTPREITNMTSYLQGRGSLYDIGYIAVFPTNGIQSFKIPFQFNPKINEGGIAAQYAATNFIGRIGAIQTYINTSGFTSASIDTSYYVLTNGTTNENSDWLEHYTFQELQNIEYLYRGLVLPSFKPDSSSTTSVFEYSSPPLIRVQFGSVKTKEDSNITGTSIFTYPPSYANGDSTYVNFLATSLTITKDTETIPFVMTGDTGHITNNLSGFDVQLNLVEVSYDYKTILPDFNGYYNSVSKVDPYIKE